MPNGEPSEPEVLAKPETPFFLNPKLLGGLAVLVLIIGGLFVSKTFLQPKPGQPQPPPQQVVKPAKSLKGLIGIIRSVDPARNRISVNAEGKNQSFSVSQDVLISQIVLGAIYEDGKQISLPTNLLYIEDLKTKTGQEVYLVFDEAGENVIQIQMFQKTAQR